MNSKTLVLILLAMSGISMAGDEPKNYKELCSVNYMDGIYSTYTDDNKPWHGVYAYRCPEGDEKCHWWCSNPNGDINDVTLTGPYVIWRYDTPPRNVIERKKFILRYQNGTTNVTMGAKTTDFLVVTHAGQPNGTNGSVVPFMTKMSIENPDKLVIRGLFWWLRDKIAYFSASKPDSPKDVLAYEMVFTSRSTVEMKPTGKKVVLDLFKACVDHETDPEPKTVGPDTNTDGPDDEDEEESKSMVWWIVVLVIVIIICVALALIFISFCTKPKSKSGPKPVAAESGTPAPKATETPAPKGNGVPAKKSSEKLATDANGQPSAPNN